MHLERKLWMDFFCDDDNTTLIDCIFTFFHEIFLSNINRDN